MTDFAPAKWKTLILLHLAYNLEPVYSIAFAAVLFGELQELNGSFWLGISLIVISVVIQTVRAS